VATLVAGVAVAPLAAVEVAAAVGEDAV